MNPIILTSADGIDEAAANADAVFLYITKREVDAGVVGDIVDRLMCFSDRADFTRKFAHRIHLCVDGYNDDPRELSEIPEVVTLFRHIDDAWPYALHFFALDDHSLDVVFMTIIGTRNNHGQHEGKPTHDFDHERFRATLRSKITAMNALHALHGFTDAEAKAVSDPVLARLDTMLA
jgi:hypothetical protein